MYIYLILLLSLLVAQSSRRHALPLFTVLCFALITVAALRYDVGTDYRQYSEMVDYGDMLDWVEPGYRWINLQFFKLQLPGWSILTLFSLVTLSAYFIFIKRYSINPLFSLLLFFLLGYYFISFNAVRQMFAIILVMFAVQLWLEARRKIAFSVALLGALFHYSVLFVLPLYAMTLSRRPRWVYLMVLAVALLISLSGMGMSLLDLLNLGGVDNPFMIRSSTAVFKLFAPVMFLIYILYCEWHFVCRNYVYFNLFFISVVLSVIFYGINYFIRINYYFEIWLILLLPSFMSTRSGWLRFYWGGIFLIYFLMVFWINFVVLNGHDVLPYKTLFEAAL